jgi:hypothetical protein
MALSMTAVNTALITARNSSTPINPSKLVVAKRDLDASRTASFEPLRQSQRRVSCRPECQVEISRLQQLDGEYVILVADEVKGKLSADKDVTQALSLESAASSPHVTSFKEASWAWALLSLIFGSVVYASWSMVTSSTTALFHRLFLLNELQLGIIFVPNGTCPYLFCLRLRTCLSLPLIASPTAYVTLLIQCTGLGTIFGSMAIGILMNRSFRQAEVEYRAQHDASTFLGNSLPANFPIERARLKHLFWITPLFIVSTAAYGLSLNSRSLVERPGWIAVPLVLQFIIAATSNAVFAINQTLVSDLCPGKGASSTAINNLFRCSMGAVGVALVDTMISAMGVGPAFVSLGLVTIIVSPLCVVQWYWAMSWRVGKVSSK